MAPQFDVDTTLEALSLDEKISLLAGASFTETKRIPTKGVLAIKALDGPNGVRGPATDSSIYSNCFPCACSIAATFDQAIAYRIGRGIATDARAKDAHCLLGPTVCMHRHPLGGRNFEAFSEDPLLTGKLAAQYVKGLQDEGISATIKHFVANEQETRRTTVDVIISERALREIYLRPFEIVAREAKPWAFMTAYNSVNGSHCDSNTWLLKQVLRGEWGWDGLVMSDWGGTNSVAAALNAGLDLEMPGPPKLRKFASVQSALKNGEITEEVINERARNVLTFTNKLTSLAADRAMRSPAVGERELQAQIRDAAARGMVLLKNENSILPLTRQKVQGTKIALVGFSKDALAHGGGSAAVHSPYKVTPWDGLRAALGSDIEFTFALGAHRERLLPPLDKDGSCGTVYGSDGQPGFSRILYGEGMEAPTISHGHLQSMYTPLGSQESLWRTLEIVTNFTPLESGNHYMTCSGLGPSRTYIDGELVFEQSGNSDDPMGSLFLAAPEKEFRYCFQKNRTYRVRVCSEPPVNIGLEILEGRSGVRVGFSLESVHDADLQGEAVLVAKEAHLAIVFSGHDSSFETEGRDQDSFNLPHDQDGLIAAVSEANSNTIVVNSTGVPIAMPWLDQVSAVVQAWFPGQECGNAIADILTGAINPEGRLPVTFPKRIEDTPAYGNFPGTYVDEALKVTYAEGVFIGYRHFDRLDREKVNFPFGYGLSYSTFEFGTMRAVQLGEGVSSVAVDVMNSGSMDGRTLVQIYAGRSHPSDEHPLKALVAFGKFRLQAGESTSARLLVTWRDIAYFDEVQKRWVVDEGDYVLYLGNSAADILQTATVPLKRMSWKP
ncbi:hypothetical protein MKZ38_000156 [Zalerion maritima]|uniref:beta-glucosidase n=1 Tax=Zalerion maritima TaxID=339359 RepID=A0AAD5RTF5_9PEZI|nr:hypothetical protein MKZ38_000156 [Zalerion maritima]